MRTDYIAAILFGLILIAGGIIMGAVPHHPYIGPLGGGPGWTFVVPFGIVLVIFGLLAYYSEREVPRKSSTGPAQ